MFKMYIIIYDVYSIDHNPIAKYITMESRKECIKEVIDIILNDEKSLVKIIQLDTISLDTFELELVILDSKFTLL